MATREVLLALLRGGPAHGYTLKREHDVWFPDARPLAFGQVYATLARLERDSLITAEGTGCVGGPERTVYRLTPQGEAHLEAWLQEPAPVARGGSDELVRKAVVALRTGYDTAGFLARQRAAHLREIRAVTASTAPDAPSRLVCDHLIAHLDADLRWLDLALTRVATRQS